MREFKIAIDDAQLIDLQQRLDNARWPELPVNYAWRGGADIPFVRDLCAYWCHEYDWRVHERRLNERQQFMTRIDGVGLHFIHVISPRTDAMPLLLLHGWPGSIVEFSDLIDPLCVPEEADAPAFHLVVPSLPGFGFSEKPKEPGWGPTRIAAALKTLMIETLGYDQFMVQGGDWGTIIGARLAGLYPENVRALHINMPIAPPPPDATDVEKWGSEQENLAPYRMMMHSIPDALSVALTDSPSGLATWILEKFHAWSSPPGLSPLSFDRDRLITNLMIYWLTNSAGSAARIYYETARLGDQTFGAPPVCVPTGVAHFPDEPFQSPREWVERIYNIVHWTEMPRGGHFAAMEQPELLLRDIRTFFGTLR